MYAIHHKKHNTKEMTHDKPYTAGCYRIFCNSACTLYTYMHTQRHAQHYRHVTNFSSPKEKHSFHPWCDHTVLEEAAKREWCATYMYIHVCMYMYMYMCICNVHVHVHVHCIYCT